MVPKVDQWLGMYDVLSPEDHQGLEIGAAIHEFRNGLPKQEAEERAYAEYVRNKAVEVAAHHYVGMKMAVAAENSGAAKRHGEAYGAAIAHLGSDSCSAPTQEVINKIKENKGAGYSFKGHSGDRFFAKKE